MRFCLEFLVINFFFTQRTCLLLNLVYCSSSRASGTEYNKSGERTIFALIETMFTNGSGDWSSIQGRVIPKTQKNGINQEKEQYLH